MGNVSPLELSYILQLFVTSLVSIYDLWKSVKSSNILSQFFLWTIPFKSARVRKWLLFSCQDLFCFVNGIVIYYQKDVLEVTYIFMTAPLRYLQFHASMKCTCTCTLLFYVNSSIQPVVMQYSVIHRVPVHSSTIYIRSKSLLSTNFRI